MDWNAMDLYFSPLACSLASRIALYEASLDGETTFHNVTLSTKLTEKGEDFWKVTAKGQVPALITQGGDLLTEGPAVLQYIADLAPGSGLAPPSSSTQRYVLQQWLNFVSTELHKQVFAVVFNPITPKEAKAYALAEVLPMKLGFVETSLSDGRLYLAGDTFSVADAYLFVVLNWARPAGVDLGKWPAILTYYERMAGRPAVKRAAMEEMKLAGRA